MMSFMCNTARIIKAYGYQHFYTTYIEISIFHRTLFFSFEKRAARIFWDNIYSLSFIFRMIRKYHSFLCMMYVGFVEFKQTARQKLHKNHVHVQHLLHNMY